MEKYFNSLLRFLTVTFFAVAIGFCFTACDVGSSSSADSERDENVENPAFSDSLAAPSDTSVAENGKCKTEGDFVWSNSEKTAYKICTDGKWVESEFVAQAPGFSLKRFNFGAAWQAAGELEEHYRGLDYIAVWLGDNDFYNAFEKRMVDMCMSVGATPMIYGYVIAEFGKDHGLADCDVKKDSTHCTHGASLIREFFADSILGRYRAYASGMREQLEYDLYLNPDTVQSIWLIEPDFYQYSVSASEQKKLYDGTEQIGGGIPDSLMGVYFKQIVDTIRTYLPAAQIAIDISPWILDVPAWYSHFDLDIVDFASTSGGRTAAGSEKIRPTNDLTWASAHEIIGKPILADAGYDKGGKGTGHAAIWDNPKNINARIADGVIGVMQMDAAYDYPGRVDTIRVQLKALKK